MQPYLESLPNYIDGAPPWTVADLGPIFWGCQNFGWVNLVRFFKKL